MIQDGLFFVNTTHDISGVDYGLLLIDFLADLFETDDFSIVWVDAGSGRRNIAARRSCKVDLIAALQGAGGFAVECGKLPDWSGGISLYKYQRSVRHLEAIPYNFKPNQISVVLPESKLRQPEFQDRLAAKTTDLVGAVHGDYGVVRPRRHATMRYERSPYGYAAGIDGLHWLNYFGPACLKIFDVARFSAVHAFDCRAIGHSLWRLRLTDDYFDSQLPLVAEDAQRAIGDSYFMKPIQDTQEPRRASGWLLNPKVFLSLVGSLSGEAGLARDESASSAAVKPAYDYEAMYE